MEEQPKDLNLQKLAVRLHTLIVLAVIFSFYDIIVVPLLTYTIGLNTYYPIYEIIIFWLNVLFSLFDVIVFFSILNKNISDLKKFWLYLLVYKFVSLCTAAILLFGYFSWVNFNSFTSQAMIVILLLSLYLKTRGKQQNPNLGIASLIIFILLFIIDICRQFIFGQNDTSIMLDFGESIVFHFASLANYFVAFVFCWISYMSITNKGFYNSFIEALSKK